MRMLLAFAVVLSVFPPRLSPLRAAVAYAPPSGARRGAPTRRSAPAALDGVDFWASRMGGSAGLQPEATANGPGGHGATPEAALTDALSTGPTNRRPAEERAQRESIALQDALVGVQQSREDGHAHGLQPRKKLRSERPASTMYAVAPRTWDAGLQSLNAQYASDANARQQSAFLAKLDKLISHLNATVHAAPRKKVARGGMYGPPKQQEQGLTKAAKREREKLVQQLVKQKGELQRLPQAEAKELMVSMQGLLSDPTVLSQVGLADPSAEARLRAKQEVRARRVHVRGYCARGSNARKMLWMVRANDCLEIVRASVARGAHPAISACPPLLVVNLALPSSPRRHTAPLLPSPSPSLSRHLQPATGSERYRFCIEAGSGWQWEARCKPRIDPLDPFAPTRKWLDVDEVPLRVEVPVGSIWCCGALHAHALRALA
jgi:hypothetical protein